jgi:hypothetical protein
MRKIRNPRYAPEFLERKLSPSVMVAQLVTVDVSHLSASYAQITITAMDTPPANEPPNDPMPNQPSGPVVPA